MLPDDSFSSPFDAAPAELASPREDHGTPAASSRPRRHPRPPATPPDIADIMRKEYLVIEDVAVLMSVSVESVRTRIKLGTIPAPTKVGNRNYWKRVKLIRWMDGEDVPSWSPKPYRGR